MFDPRKLKVDFPILSKTVNGQPLTYLDSAATSQKPAVVIDTIAEFYREHNANAHRGVSAVTEEATALYEAARDTVAGFLNATDRREIVFTRSTTESINLIANSFVHAHCRRGDAIVLTEMEHHANLVPWYIAGEHHDIEIRFAAISPDGRLDLDDLAKQLKGASLLSLTHVSNVLGTINPIPEIVELAHREGCPVLLDAAQSAPNLPLDVQALGIDFLAFSGHKVLGPTGIGVLWGRYDRLDELRPFMGGGQMIREVDYGQVTYAEPPYRFEAGTMPQAEAVGLAAAIDYLKKLGLDEVRQHERGLIEYALAQLAELSGFQRLGPEGAADRGGLIAFTLGEIHAHDLASLVDQDGIAIRSGHHCAQPLHKKLGLPASARASVSVFNTRSDIDTLVGSLRKAQKVFA